MLNSKVLFWHYCSVSIPWSPCVTLHRKIWYNEYILVLTMHARSAVNYMTVCKEYVYKISRNTSTLMMCNLDCTRADFENSEHCTGCKGNGVKKGEEERKIMLHVCDLLNKYHRRVCYTYMFLFQHKCSEHSMTNTRFLRIITRSIECTSVISHILSSQRTHKGSVFAHTSTSKPSIHHVREVLLQWSTAAELLGTRSELIGGLTRHCQ